MMDSESGNDKKTIYGDYRNKVIKNSDSNTHISKDIGQLKNNSFSSNSIKYIILICLLLFLGGGAFFLLYDRKNYSSKKLNSNKLVELNKILSQFSALESDITLGRDSSVIQNFVKGDHFEYLLSKKRKDTTISLSVLLDDILKKDSLINNLYLKNDSDIFIEEDQFIKMTKYLKDSCCISDLKMKLLFEKVKIITHDKADTITAFIE